MDAFKDALKKRMYSSEMMKPSVKIEIGSEGEEEEDEENPDQKDNLAPELKGPMNGDAMSMMSEGDEENPDAEADKEMILQVLADKGSAGRSPNSLGERAAMGAKSKLDMMSKMKMKK